MAHPVAAKHAGDLLAESPPLDSVQMEYRRVRSETGPYRRRCRLVRPVDEAREGLPIHLIGHRRGAGLGPRYDEAIELARPQSVDGFIVFRDVCAADLPTNQFREGKQSQSDVVVRTGSA